ncbi:hypothetical protein [Actinomadura sp. KC06]|uniref:hypothetical protein n=1 Tax=Actinomadura sp. KC06 TaxID=2530369 RepID=UPI001A9D9CB2|nr:hypothetical protein [Actinomadura sp. KC06]
MTVGGEFKEFTTVVSDSESPACLDVTAKLAASTGILNRLVVVHADLGQTEWPGTPELVREHAATYGCYKDGKAAPPPARCASTSTTRSAQSTFAALAL